MLVMPFGQVKLPDVTGIIGRTKSPRDPWEVMVHLKLGPEQFIAGLFHALAIKDRTTLPFRLKPFHRAVKETRSRLGQIAGDFNVKPGFTVLVNEDGRSSMVGFCLQWLLAEQLIAFDDDRLRQKLHYQYHREYAHEKLEQLPGGPELFLDLADWFLRHYSEMETATSQPSS